MLSFLVLGPMEVRTHDRTVTFKGPIQQTLLAMFLCSGEKLITVNALIEELWGTTPPATVENALQANISRLRRTLARLEPRRQESRLATRTSGYQFNLERAELDAAKMLETVDSIRARAGNYRRRDVADLREVLALWRGPVFGGLTGGPICQAAVAKYDEYRTAALVMLYEAELAGGEHAKIVPELRELVTENSSQECFSSLLMIALYRSGRQTDALTVARQLRTNLIDELGIEPSPAVQDLERAILNHDIRMRQENTELPWLSYRSGRAA
ncbi:AfsR/SARP family transcriptional regulator [Phytohabitans houttuyneae]|uniref:AfsR/SARP family transcriptional regulator n=1 Tax=Phytohabitans houttuyneae TaxID=1076126 RepID=UPI00156436E2|nr:AfsR/SARP family transcriptional regulator [Phytohabitans houttuyneae]